MMSARSPGKRADHGAITGLERARDRHQPLLAGRRGEAVGDLGEREAGALDDRRRSFAMAGLPAGGGEQARGERRARNEHDGRSGRDVPSHRSEQAGGDRDDPDERCRAEGSR